MNSLDIPIGNFYAISEGILEKETPKRMGKWNLFLDFFTNQP
jgi:hypothetical protein